MGNDEIIDLTKMDKDEICHIKCHQRKSLILENKKLRDALEFYASDQPVYAKSPKVAREALAEIDGDKTKEKMK